jgi:hypothetical protein
LRGWDPDGVPTPGRLADLGLDRLPALSPAPASG